MRRLFFAGVMLFAGCSGSTGPKMAELSELPTSIPVRTLWQASVGDAGDAILFPALAVDGVYAAAQDGTVARFEAATGRASWRVNAGRTRTRSRDHPTESLSARHKNRETTWRHTISKNRNSSLP